MSENFVLRSRYDGLDVSVLAVRPESEPSAVLQLSHGMRGCKERFIPMMEYMAARGIACVANDHRGHGASVHSAEDLGYMYRGGYEALVDDMVLVNEWCHAEFPGCPVYLLGHSMGSLAARTFVKRHDDMISGLFVCGSPSRNPAAGAAFAFTRLLCLVGLERMRPERVQKLVSHIYNLRFRKEGPESWTCSDPEVRRAFSENPLCRFYFTANAAQSLLMMMRETYSDSGWLVSNPDMPVYFISGGDDPCMLSERKFHESAGHMADVGYSDVTSAIYSGMRHEVLNEKGRETVWRDVVEHILGD